MSKLRLVEQANDVLVLGTDQIVDAAQLLRSSTDVTRWGSSNPGLFVRRDRKWKSRAGYFPPKDAKPGVLFVGVIRKDVTSIADPAIASRDAGHIQHN